MIKVKPEERRDVYRRLRRHGLRSSVAWERSQIGGETLRDYRRRLWTGPHCLRWLSAIKALAEAKS